MRIERRRRLARIPDHDRVPAAVRVGKRRDQCRGLRAPRTGQRPAVAGIEELGHDPSVPGRQRCGLVSLPRLGLLNRMRADSVVPFPGAQLNLLRPEKVVVIGLGPVLVLGGCWAVAGQLARAAILARLWVSTPCPHQIAAPCLPSRRVRSQP